MENININIEDVINPLVQEIAELKKALVIEQAKVISLQKAREPELAPTED